MYMNRCNLEKLVTKVYRFVEGIIFDSTKRKEAVVKTILTLCDCAGFKYEEDYFVENIEEAFDYITRYNRYLDPKYNKKELFLDDEED